MGECVSLLQCYSINKLWFTIPSYIIDAGGYKLLIFPNPASAWMLAWWLAFPLMGVMAWTPSEADSAMKFNMPDVYLGVCFWNKHLLKGEEGSRSGRPEGEVMLPCRLMMTSAGHTDSGVRMAFGSHVVLHGQVFLGLWRSIVLFCFCYILPLIGECES